jgi:histone H3/H4
MTTGLLLVLSLSLVVGSLSLPTASAALLTAWVPTARLFPESFSSIIGAMATFEGTLQAYSVGGDSQFGSFITKADVILETNLLQASDDLSAALEALNVELIKNYASLSKEQQQAIEQAYSSLGSYLEKLAEDATQIVQDDGKSTITFEFLVDKSTTNKFGGYWIGFALGD